MSIAAVVLAAGIGKRMKSRVPKVLHPVLGKPMLSYVIDAVRGVSPAKIVVVLGRGRDDVKKSVDSKGIIFVEQGVQLGTGHAANCARKELGGFRGDILVLNGDFPLITSQSLKSLVKKHESEKADISILTARLQDPFGYGRVLRNNKGEIESIVEERDASPEERKINEINSGTYCVKSGFLWEALNGVGSGNKQKEYYLTDIIGIARKKSRKISGVVARDSNEVVGVNDRAQLSEVEALLRKRINDTLMRAGVTLIDPGKTYISPDARIGTDTVIYPNTYIYGKTIIGRGCSIGPGAWIEDFRARKRRYNKTFFLHLEISHKGRCYCRSLRPHSPRCGNNGGRKDREFRRDKKVQDRQGIKSSPFVLHRRRSHREGCQYRSWEHYLQLRRIQKARDRHRGRGVHRQRHDACSPAQGRQGCDHRCGLDYYERRTGRRPRNRQGQTNGN